MKKFIYIIILIMAVSITVQAQEEEKKTYDFENMTRKEIMEISYDEMLEMSFEDLKLMAETLGVSTEELLNLALNREVSSASKKGESVFESPLSTTVITKEEIQVTGVSTYEELFRLVPGMIVREESNGNFDIHIRGNDNLPPGNFSHFSENMMTLVMVDGRIVYNYINGGTIWEAIPVALSDIERIEIIRGASSALYGPNAVSGVINIITRNPNKDGAHLHGDIKAGNYNSYIGSFSFLNKVNDKFGIKLSGAYDFRDRSQDDFYQYLTDSYVSADSMTSMFYNKLAASSPEPLLAKKAQNANAGLFYTPNADVYMSLNSGYQSSESQSMFFENLATPFGIRTSETTYLDYKASAYGLHAQINYLFGHQNLHRKMIKPVIEYDMGFLNANVEYDLELNNLGSGQLTIRPGVNYQRATYDDEKYVRKIDTVGELDKGLLNGEKMLETMSAGLRIDYKPFSKLRFIAALRADKYSIPEDLYFSWQFVGAYNISSKHLIRTNYSRANRGSFIGNAYANFQNPLQENAYNPGNNSYTTYYQYYMGTDELDKNTKLLTQDLIEVGYRGMFSDMFQLDLEGFFTKTENFDVLLPRTIQPSSITIGGVTYIEVNDKWYYQNTDLQSRQFGFTGTINLQPMDNLLVKIFGTYQHTQLKNVLKDISEMYASPINVTRYENLPDSAFADKENTWTPNFYGGFMVNYAPVNKVNINISSYYMGKQTYSRYFYQASVNTHTTKETSIDPNIILNANVSYKVSSNASIYLSAHNLLDHNQTEIPYNDKIRGLYMFGINFSF